MSVLNTGSQEGKKLNNPGYTTAHGAVSIYGVSQALAFQALLVINFKFQRQIRHRRYQEVAQNVLCRRTPRGCCYTRPMSVSWFARICIFLSTVILFLAVFPTASSTHIAIGRFEVYCDGVGFFLAKIDGAPAPGELVLFLYLDFPPGAIYLPAEKWADVFVYRKGCAADGKCEITARGRVWLDAEATPGAKRISGKYEIDLNGQHLNGQFVAKRHEYKYPPRICI